MTSPSFKASVFTLLVLFSSALLLNAQMSAFDTLEAFGKKRGQADLKRVVGVTGTLGQDQPQQWLVLMKDSSIKNLLHEYAMKKGKLVSERHFTSEPEHHLPSIVIPLNQLNTDSNKAFQIANQAASRSNIGFDSISYLLRVHSTSASPVWTLTLIDQQKNIVGIVHIVASTGKLLNRTWYRPGSPEYTQLNEHTATDEIKDLWSRGVSSVSKGFKKIDKKIGEKLKRD